MNQEILDFLNTQRLGVLAIQMLDNAPHADVIHFAHLSEPLTFFFETTTDSRKAKALYGNSQSFASLVIGLDESNLKTLQLDGIVRIVQAEQDRAAFDAAYLAKFPERKEIIADPKTISVIFQHTWWRFTDWTKEGGKLVLESNQL
jgi:general stress protein 26